MTLKPIENEPSEKTVTDLLLLESKKVRDDYVLTKEGPLFSMLPPNVLMALLGFMKDPDLSPPKFKHSEFFIDLFDSASEAEASYPGFQSSKAHPFIIGNFISGEIQQGIFDFELGSVMISKSPLTEKDKSPGAYLHILPPMLNYALSPELWGQDGKWTRFHEKLIHVFQKHDLLLDSPGPGMYVVKNSARDWKKILLKGNLSGEALTLTLPWTFSLKALEKLEIFIGQEP